MDLKPNQAVFSSWQVPIANLPLEIYRVDVLLGEETAWRTFFHSGPVRGNWSVTASWDIETTLGGAEYTNWVISQLQTESKIVRAEGSQLAFSRQVDGDTHSIECKFTLVKEKLYIHVAFSAYRD